MHSTLTVIKKELDKLIARLKSQIPNDEPFGTAHNNWSFPDFSRAELIEDVQSLIDLIESQGGDDVGDQEARLQDYVRRLQLLEHTIDQIWGNAAQAVPTFLLTLGGLRKTLTAALGTDGHANAVVKLKKLTSQLRSMEATLNGLAPSIILSYHHGV